MYRPSEFSQGGTPTRPPSELIALIRSGDREAAAEILTRYRPLIRQRCRAQIGAALNSVTDSEDLWSTVARRVDTAIVRGATSFKTESAFWAFVSKLIRNAVIDRSRVLARLNRVADDDAPFAAILRERLEHELDALDSGVLAAAIDAIESSRDREILTQWLCERTHGQIAESLGMTEAAVRVRWHEIRQRLRTHFTE